MKISILLEALTGSFETDIKRASKTTEKEFAKMQKEAEAFGKKLGVALTAATAAIAVIVQKQANAIANFQQLSEKIGDTAQNVASLNLAAQVSGVTLDTVAAASVKLTASLSKLDDEGKGAGLAIKNLGLDFEAFKKLSPVEQIDAVAKALAGFEDGAAKTATAVALFGKSGAELIPFLNDLADGSERQIILTNEQIKAADDYTKSISRLTGEIDLLVKEQVVGLIPIMNDVVNILSETTKYSKGLSTDFSLLELAMGGIKNIFQTVTVLGANVAFVFAGIGREIGGIGAQLTRLAVGDFKGFRIIGDAIKEDAVRARAELDAFEQRILNPERRAAAPSAAGRRPTLSGNYATGSVDKAAKDAEKAAKDALKLIEDAEDLHFKELFRRESDFVDERQKLRKEDLDKQLAMLKEAADKAVSEAERLLRPNKFANLSSDIAENPFASSAFQQGAIDEENALNSERLRMFEQEREAIIASGQDYNKVLEKEEEEHQRRLTAIAKEGAEGRAQVGELLIGATQNILSTIGDLQDKSSREGFERYKKIAIAQAIISTIESAVNAYKSLSGIPYVGPALGAAAAAAAVAAGYARVDQIRQESYPGRRFGGGVSGGGMYEVAEGGDPELLKYGNKTVLMMGDKSGVVSPAKVGSSGESGKLTVNLYGAPAGAQVEANQGQGGMNLDIIFDGMERRLAGNAAQGKGPLVKTMERSYALQRQGA